MGTVRYTVINGETVAEKRNGVRSLYVPDSLGTTRALLDDTQAQTDTFVAWPYGEVVHETGSNPTPLTFVGAQGYHTDSPSRIYVRNRVDEPQKGAWLTEDPIGFGSGSSSLYGYVGAQPVTVIDPDGYGTGDGQAIVDCAKKEIGQHCSFSNPDPKSGLACVQVWTNCVQKVSGGKYGKSFRCTVHGGKFGPNCLRSVGDVGGDLRHRGGSHWNQPAKKCKVGGLITFWVPGYGNSRFGGHGAVISEVGKDGLPTKMIVCSGYCNPPDTVCEMTIADWLKACNAAHAQLNKGQCHIVGCGSYY